MSIRRIYVTKKEGNDVASKKLRADLAAQLGIEVEDVKIYLRYDVDGMDDNDFSDAVTTVFSEPPVDRVYFESMPVLSGYETVVVEYLPGQFDQRADSAAQCVQLLTKKERPVVRCATVYAIKTAVANLPAIKKYIINPVEARLASEQKPKTLDVEIGAVKPTESVRGFIDFNEKKVSKFREANGLAMTTADLLLVQDYFKAEHRDPNYLEIKVIDTYWSDHCRHTTFLTRLDEFKVTSNNPHIEHALMEYQELFSKHYKNRPEKYACLMDIATIAVRELKEQGRLDDLDASEEINACSIKVKARIGKREEDWLVMFKNETHNHPTEIEPFGGAATCLGGAIRDPLSGRVYVYQAMRVTGSADPRTPFAKTLKGKLPSRVISKTAAAGFSSYGNQIGLATGLVHEVYHPNYVAKRLETGFVVGAAPAQNVVRSTPENGDLIILIGGETGRDGCGGATGSSKAHSKSSVDTCGAEVQKGNAPTERKLQRLFRNPDFTKLVKRCNDFGAGGVCVAIGELAPGLDIFLDRVPKKYEGLTATELAISESQERMAVVIESGALKRVLELAATENLTATHVATVTDTNRLRMQHENREVLNLSREFLDTNGAVQHATAVIADGATKYFDKPSGDAARFVAKGDSASALKSMLADLANCSQKGLGEMFDSTIGANSVLMPYGGRSQLTPSIAMAAKLPVLSGDTTTATVAAFGYDPYLMSETPFMGAIYSIVNSVTKVVATGAPFDSIRLTLQEYFMRLGEDPKRWGIPTAALLGALHAQLRLGLGAIGGKDSMSGTFEKIDVPPTLISFALGIADADKIISNALKSGNQQLTLLKVPRDKYGMLDFDVYTSLMRKLGEEIDAGNVTYATVVEQGGAATAVAQSVLGAPEIGFKFYRSDADNFLPHYGNVVIAAKSLSPFDKFDKVRLGETTTDGVISFHGSSVTNQQARDAFTGTLEQVYPTSSGLAAGGVEDLSFSYRKGVKKASVSVASPRVLIPVFPGTNCEYDTMRQFNAAGAAAEAFVIRNLSTSDVEDSVKALVKQINNTQILAFAGGFSGGDEPDGSGKFIATTFRNPAIAEAVRKLLERDGLIIGICNGFQALVKLGLLPYGEITPMKEDSPTLTFNNISRHVSTVSKVRVSSCLSPWLAGCRVGQEYAVPVSHGEGKFVCSEADYAKMKAAGQIFSQYVDDKFLATMQSPFNPNGSNYAIEGITSPDGRILGKMGHAERVGTNVMKNIDFATDMKLFASGVRYFK